MDADAGTTKGEAEMRYCKGKNGLCDLKTCTIKGKLCEYYDGTGCVEVITNADRIRSMTDEELANYHDELGI